MSKPDRTNITPEQKTPLECMKKSPLQTASTQGRAKPNMNEPKKHHPRKQNMFVHSRATENSDLTEVIDMDYPQQRNTRGQARNSTYLGENAAKNI